MEHIAHLKKDKRLAKIIVEPVSELRTHKNIPLTLIESIMSQQLSTKVVQVIHKRFLALYNDKEPTLREILGTPLTTFVLLDCQMPRLLMYTMWQNSALNII